jgi:predicted N-formylglutamate amidohydrolase
VELFLPYHRAIAAELDSRAAAGVRPLVLAIHSCTPAMNGIVRPWPVGVSYAAPGRLARRLVAALALAGIDAGDNEPYSMDLEVDYTAPEHALRRGLPCLQVEFRQDLVATMAGARLWADRFIDALATIPADEVAADPVWTPPWPAPHGTDDARLLLAAPAEGPR